MISLDFATRSAIERFIDALNEQLDEMPDNDPRRQRISEIIQRLEDALLWAPPS